MRVGTWVGWRLCLTLWLVSEAVSNVNAIDILTLLGKDALDTIASTPADLPPPMMPPFVTDEILQSLDQLDESIQDREAEEKGDEMGRGFELQSSRIRLAAAEEYGAFMASQASIRTALGCYHLSEQAAEMRAKVDLRAAFNQSIAKHTVRARELGQLRQSYQSEKALNQRSKDTLLHLTRLINGQQEAKYSNLLTGSLFDHAFATMDEKLNKVATTLEFITGRHDVSDSNLTSSFGIISKVLQCVSCDKAQAMIQRLSNSTQSHTWKEECQRAEEASAAAIKAATSDITTKRQTFDDLEAAYNMIDTHRSQMQPQNEDAKAFTNKLSRAMLGETES